MHLIFPGPCLCWENAYHSSLKGSFNPQKVPGRVVEMHLMFPEYVNRQLFASMFVMSTLYGDNVSLTGLCCHQVANWLKSF